MMDSIKYKTENDKAMLLCSVIEAAELHLTIGELDQNLSHGIDNYTLGMSMSDGIWNIILSRNGKDEIEGSGETLTTAIASLLPYIYDWPSPQSGGC